MSTEIPNPPDEPANPPPAQAFRSARAPVSRNFSAPGRLVIGYDKTQVHAFIVKAAAGSCVPVSLCAGFSSQSLDDRFQPNKPEVAARPAAYACKACRDSVGREFARDEHHRNTDPGDRSGAGEEHSGQAGFDVRRAERPGLAEGVGERRRCAGRQFSSPAAPAESSPSPGSCRRLILRSTTLLRSDAKRTLASFALSASTTSTCPRNARICMRREQYRFGRCCALRELRAVQSCMGSLLA